MSTNELNLPDFNIPEELDGKVSITTLDRIYNFGRRSSIWPMMFGLACCAIEMIAAQAARYDMARFGMALSYIGAAKHAEAEPILAELGRTGKAGDPDQIAVLRAQCMMRLNRLPEAMKILEGVAGGSSKKHLPAAFFTLTDFSFQQS
ncbi:MAG: hypothetical protein NT121_22100, partial [Chloroflexi bacterium]|nr:hypothetical protein [Chloroflexota bacterium]